MGVRELRRTLGSLSAPLLALEPLHFTGRERRTKKYQIHLSSDSGGGGGQSLLTFTIMTNTSEITKKKTCNCLIVIIQHCSHIRKLHLLNKEDVTERFQNS